MEDTNPQLSDFYYRDNFLKLTSHALHWYQGLLRQDEIDWIKKFERLPENSQALLVRLLSRKGHLFRSDKLNYSEIENIQQAASLLAECSFIQIGPEIDFVQAANYLLTKPEIVQLFPSANKKLSKQALIESICETEGSACPPLPFQVYLLCNHQFINILSLLFFANTRQDLTQFVVSDLGIQRFEPYLLSTELRFFQSREQVDDLLILSQLSDHFYSATIFDEAFLDELTERLPPSSAHHYVKRKHCKLINLIAREYERLGCHQKALKWFATTSLPPARERQIRILEKSDQDIKARQLLEKMCAQPYDQAEFEVAQRLDTRLRRKAGERISRSKEKISEQHLILDLSSQRVELAVKAHYDSSGWRSFYTENTLLNALFGLAFWDIIFAPVEGAFINSYQQQPLDLYYPEFTRRRQSAITHRLRDINKDHKALIKKNYVDKQGTANAFVHWSAISPELLDHTLKAFTASQLCELFRIQLSDLKQYRSGMPDLIAFKDGEFLWIEVKGPGDKLQDSQKRWIKQFERLGIPYRVCYVTDTARCDKEP